MTIGIIGGGTMGSAMAKAFLEKKVVLQKDLIVSSEPGKNIPLVRQDVLVMAVKPQQFAELSKEICGKISAQTIVLSIMAGVSLETISKFLGHRKIIRSMPNTPALLGQGVIGWYSSPEIEAKEKKVIESLLGCLGTCFEVGNEDLLNQLSVISGSGPGFFFALFDAWLKATDQFNIPENQRKQMLQKTCLGSLALLEATVKTAEKLKNEVASKGGITEAGLKILEADLDNRFAKTLEAAYTRCKEMAKS